MLAVMLLAPAGARSAEAPPAGSFTAAPVPGLSLRQTDPRDGAGARGGREMDVGPMNSTPFSGAPMPMPSGDGGRQHGPGESGPGAAGVPRLSR